MTPPPIRKRPPRRYCSATRTKIRNCRGVDAPIRNRLRKWLRNEECALADFVESLGLPFFAHRLRRLSETLVEASGGWLREVGVAAPPKAVSTLLLIAAEGPSTVTEIATRLRLSHPLIVKLA